MKCARARTGRERHLDGLGADPGVRRDGAGASPARLQIDEPWISIVIASTWRRPMHASARPGARDLLHPAGVAARVPARPRAVRTASNTTLRPGVRDRVRRAQPAHAHDERVFGAPRRRRFPARRAGRGLPTRAARGSVSVSGTGRGGGRPAARRSWLFAAARTARDPDPRLRRRREAAVTAVDAGYRARGSPPGTRRVSRSSQTVRRTTRRVRHRWCRARTPVTASGDGTLSALT